MDQQLKEKSDNREASVCPRETRHSSLFDLRTLAVKKNFFVPVQKKERQTARQVWLAAEKLGRTSLYTKIRKCAKQRSTETPQEGRIEKEGKVREILPKEFCETPSPDEREEGDRVVRGGHLAEEKQNQLKPRENLQKKREKQRLVAVPAPSSVLQDEQELNSNSSAASVFFSGHLACFCLDPVATPQVPSESTGVSRLHYTDRMPQPRTSFRCTQSKGLGSTEWSRKDDNPQLGRQKVLHTEREQ